MDQTTPPKPRAVATDTQQPVSSTPGSRGSAVIGPGIGSTNNNYIAPWIARDIDSQKKCGFEELLIFLLESCWEKCPGNKAGEKPPSDLLEKCLAAVLPIANGKMKPPKDGRLQDSTSITAGSIRKFLTEYCTIKGTEMDRYAPFANAFNTALLFLSDLDIPFLPPLPPSESQIIFHRNDPKLIKNRPGNGRKPDIVLVEHRHAQAKRKSAHWDSSMEIACKAPSDEPFQWTDVLCSLEFKRDEAGLDPPPSSYVLDKKPDYIDWKTVPSNWRDEWESQNQNEGQNVKLGPQLGNAQSDQPDSGLKNQSETVSLSSGVTSEPGSSRPAGSATREKIRNAKRVPKSSLSASSQPPRQSSGSNKRKSDSTTHEQSKKIKSDSMTDEQMKTEWDPIQIPRRDPPAIVQAGFYAADRMSIAFDMNFTINIVLFDDVAWVWWYDREGAIQTKGINFVQNLPQFLVLVLAFQRFNGWNWGQNLKLRPAQGNNAISLCIPVPGAEPLQLRLDPKSPAIMRHFGIVGRCTTVVPATSVSPDPRDRAKTLKGLELVVKISWTEKSRDSEKKILDKAYALAEEEVKIRNHLPDLIWEFDMVEPECCTATIRGKLGMVILGTRILRILVFGKLYPITRLTGDVFLRAFQECFECHYYLWRGGVRHRDISVTNLMYAERQGHIRGVLNDFDLSSLGLSDTPNGTQRTGTVPYMALDLLTTAAVAGKVKHRYRHDAESFVWALVVICTCYLDKKPFYRSPFVDWMRLDHEPCRKEKLGFLHFQRNMTSEPTDSYLQAEAPLRELLNYVHNSMTSRDIALQKWERMHKGVKVAALPPLEEERLEKPDEEVFLEYLDAMQG